MYMGSMENDHDPLLQPTFNLHHIVANIWYTITPFLMSIQGVKTGDFDFMFSDP